MTTSILPKLGALVLMTLPLAACAADTSEQSSDENIGTASEPLSVANCDLQAFPPNGSRYSEGKLTCATRQNLELQVCLQQLVTGGWQTLQWTCVNGGGDFKWIDTTSRSVPYYTSGRWYRTWVWGSVNGVTGVTVSSGIQG